MRRRPDIRAAELNAAAQSAQIGLAEADLSPAFSLTGSFGGAASNVRRATLGDVFTGKGFFFAFGPSFSWNILNYGQITNISGCRTQSCRVCSSITRMRY